MVRAAVFLAEGTEEMEFAIVYDVLVRAKVTVDAVYVPKAGGASKPEHGLVRASRGVRLAPDTTLAEVVGTDWLATYDALIVPGGAEGADTISADATVCAMLRGAYEANKVVASVCAGTLAILEAGIAHGTALTSHPSVAHRLEKRRWIY